MYDCEPYNFLECYIDFCLWATLPVIFILVGVVGNTLNIIILSRKRIRQISTTVCLRFLAVSDMLFMISFCIPKTISKMTGKRLIDKSGFTCKTINWVRHTSAGVSAWLLVLLTTERVLRTKWPYVARAWLSSRTALNASLVTAIMCALFPAHYFFGFELQLVTDQFNQTCYSCLPRSVDFEQFYKYRWKIMVLGVLNIIPVCIITAGNLALLAAIVKQKRQLRRVAPNIAKGTSVAGRRQKSSTHMLFILSGFFMITTLPYTVFRVYKDFNPAIGPREYARDILLESATEMLLYCNFTLNFFLYFVSGTLFKQEWQCFCSGVYMRLRYVFNGSERRRTTVSAIGPLRQR